MAKSEVLSEIDNGLVDVIIEAYKRGFSVKSDFARLNADYVAMAASMGLVSTRLHSNFYSREWRPTVEGLMFVERLQLEDDE